LKKEFGDFFLSYIMEKLSKIPKKNPQKIPKFFCEFCNYTTNNKKDYNKHLMTRKHKMIKMITEDKKKSPDDNMQLFSCICGKKYKFESGLCRHKAKCNYIKYVEEDIEIKEEDNKIIEYEEDDDMLNDDVNYKEMFLKLMSENNELKSMIIQQNSTHMNESKELLNMVKSQQEQHNNQMRELLPKVGNNNITTTNNKVNIQIFLNENCKDAVNINDFLEGIQLQLQDLEKMKEIGYVNGITQIFKNGLNKLDLTQRPLHCSDIKREVLYVKDEDGWEKDNNKEKLNKAISTVGRKTLQHFPEWMEKHPKCNDTNTPANDEYHALIENTVAQNTEDNKKKIMKNILKEVTIDKDK
tara:strand:+ start:218 stop:1282 length:1065 start_codon:yes stop_codon:yes gene_type:complete